MYRWELGSTRLILACFERRLAFPQQAIFIIIIIIVHAANTNQVSARYRGNQLSPGSPGRTGLYQIYSDTDVRMTVRQCQHARMELPETATVPACSQTVTCHAFRTL